MAWLEEINRRSDELDAGSVETIPAEDVIAKALRRAEAAVKVEFHPCARFWPDRDGNVSAYEKAKVLAVTGGVPRCLEEIDAARPEENIKRLCFTRGGLPSATTREKTGLDRREQRRQREYLLPTRHARSTGVPDRLHDPDEIFMSLCLRDVLLEQAHRDRDREGGAGEDRSPQAPEALLLPTGPDSHQWGDLRSSPRVSALRT